MEMLKKQPLKSHLTMMTKIYWMKSFQLEVVAAPPLLEEAHRHQLHGGSIVLVLHLEPILLLLWMLIHQIHHNLEDLIHSNLEGQILSNQVDLIHSSLEQVLLHTFQCALVFCSWPNNILFSITPIRTSSTKYAYSPKPTNTSQNDKCSWTFLVCNFTASL